MTKQGRVTVVIAALALTLTGCASEPVPTGNVLVGEAKQHYLDYRGITNDVQALIYDGPWESDIGGYGMQPSGASCDDDSYGFDLTRTTRAVDASDHAVARDKVLDYLKTAGYEMKGQELGSGKSQSSDVIVNKQGDFKQLMVTFIANGAILVTATTACWPGDGNELSTLIFGGENLSEGYLPREESPSDPLFFGITPGEPAFVREPTE